MLSGCDGQKLFQLLPNHDSTPDWEYWLLSLLYQHNSSIWNINMFSCYFSNNYLPGKSVPQMLLPVSTGLLEFLIRDTVKYTQYAPVMLNAARCWLRKVICHPSRLEWIVSLHRKRWLLLLSWRSMGRLLTATTLPGPTQAVVGFEGCTIAVKLVNLNLSVPTTAVRCRKNFCHSQAVKAFVYAREKYSSHIVTACSSQWVA